MSIYAIIWIGLQCVGLGIVAAKHGERQPNYNFWSALIGTIIGTALLYFGGFFN